MKQDRHKGPAGPSQRMLRVGEALRHALAEVLYRNAASRCAQRVDRAEHGFLRLRRKEGQQAFGQPGRRLVHVVAGIAQRLWPVVA